MRRQAEDVVALRVTPLVFAALFAVGAWTDPLGMLSPWADVTNRLAMIVACAASVASAVHPTEHFRFAALAGGSWATLSRGLTLIIVGTPDLGRKAELVGGSVWMICSYLVLFTWLVTVPIVRWRHDQQ